MMTARGQPKMKIPLSAITKSRSKVTYNIRLKPYVPPKVKQDIRTKTESQLCLGRHGYRSQQVPPSVRCQTIPCIWYLSTWPRPSQPCGVTRPTVPDADADNAATSLV